ncbi:hypothetical protein M9H77_13085 [Catharanthus roseus]|uniref:Uncharacterized protein n=1 Tax=Catharanthus roseus TaxID=4058 RepID=A0ACC0BJ80_CATRO|nr:hypothetical protein M9H77_13085 [Catharanthus roseus]
MKKRSNRSPMKKRKRKSFNRSPILRHRIKKRAHPNTSTPPIATSTPPGMSPSLTAISSGTSPSLTVASTPPGTSTPLAATSTPPAILTPFSQLPYSSPAPTSTSSFASFTTGMLWRPASLSSAHLPGVVNSCILIISTAESFNKQSNCVKLITEILKAHFVEAYLGFEKVPDRIKNMCSIEFRVSIYIMIKEVLIGPDA